MYICKTACVHICIYIYTNVYRFRGSASWIQGSGSRVYELTLNSKPYVNPKPSRVKDSRFRGWGPMLRYQGLGYKARLRI